MEAISYKADAASGRMGTADMAGEAFRLLACLAAALVGVWAASAAWAVAAGLAAWIVWGAFEARAFRRWARSPLRRPRLMTSTWRASAHRLHQCLRRSRSRTRRLIAELRWLQGTLNSMPDGWIVLQRDGAIEAANRGAGILLGFARHERRRYLTDLVREPSVAALVRGDVEDGIVELASPVDDSRRLEMRHLPVDEARSIVLIRDVTMLNRLLTMRQDFIANVSHELRTPLTVIIGYLEALEDEDIDRDTLRQLLDKLNAPAARMKALVDDLLMLTRLESSPMPGAGDVEPVNAAAMLEAVVREARQLATSAHDIVLDADPNLVASAVPAELHSAFFNLVANAIRYSPDGGIVSVRWRQGETSPRFEVEDRGLGIPPEHISRLTERFFRVDLAKGRVRGGTGLGLAIVKHILRRHHTRLEVESTLGEGSLFSFELPADQREGQQAGRL